MNPATAICACGGRFGLDVQYLFDARRYCVLGQVPILWRCRTCGRSLIDQHSAVFEASREHAPRGRGHRVRRRRSRRLVATRPPAARPPAREIDRCIDFFGDGGETASPDAADACGERFLDSLEPSLPDVRPLRPRASWRRTPAPLPGAVFDCRTAGGAV